MPVYCGHMREIILKRVADHHLPLIETWLQAAHVRPWFSDPEAWLAELAQRGDVFDFITHFVAYHHDVPFGFCQYYPIERTDEAVFIHCPREGSYSIDYLIGESAYLSRGFGSAMLSRLVDHVFAHREAERIVVSVDDGNGASQRLLIRTGFMFHEAWGVFALTREAVSESRARCSTTAPRCGR